MCLCEQVGTVQVRRPILKAGPGLHDECFGSDPLKSGLRGLLFLLASEVFMATDLNAGAPRADDILTGERSSLARISESPAGIRLNNLLQVIAGLGEDAEEEYQRALKAVREDLEEVLVEVAQASSDCCEHDYPLRMALVQIASELRHPASLPYLANIIKTPIADEKSGDPHSFSTVAEETIIRTAAVDGVAELARHGDERASRLLMEFVRLPSFSIRRAAVMGLLATKDGDQFREEIKSLLPDDQQFILEMRRIEVQEVPQVRDPTRHLRDKLREGRIAIPPKLAKDSDGDNGPPSAG